MKFNLEEEVKDIDIAEIKTIENLIYALGYSGGFTAKNVATAYEILKKMTSDIKCVNFLSFPADIVSTGTRGVIKDLLKKKMFNIVITTSGAVDHDLARSVNPYYHGDFNASDVELHKAKIHRLGNIFIPFNNYGIAIEHMTELFLKELEKEKEYSLHELLWELGKFIGKKDSILYWTYKNQIPVVIPGIFDGAFGYQLWQHWQMGEKLKINFFKDESLLSDTVYKAKKSGALIIGGGISKHHTIWWNQFKDGLDYAVYITTAQEFDGSLSGARPKEAVSWGKIKETGKHVVVDGDATVVLPMLVKALIK